MHDQTAFRMRLQELASRGRSRERRLHPGLWREGWPIYHTPGSQRHCFEGLARRLPHYTKRPRHRRMVAGFALLAGPGRWPRAL